MTKFRRVALSLLAVSLISVGSAGVSWADAPRSNVIGDAEIQAQIDQRIDTQSADRQAVQDLLRRPDVRRIAGAAGLSIERVNAAAGVLSGPDLKNIATRVHELDGTVGGRESVTLSVTAIVIILLLIIILAN